jgi:4-hydroxybenzoate polyprenyltransferase
LLLLAGAPGSAWLLEAESIDLQRALLFGGAVLALGAHVMTANAILGRRTWEADSAAMDYPLADSDWHPGLMTRISVATLGSSLLLFALLSLPTAGLAALIASLWLLYAHPRTRWKGRPLLDTFVHVASGPLLYGLGLAAAGGRGEITSAGWAAVFTLLLVGGHFHHVVKDLEPDRAAGLETVGRRIGILPSLAIGSACFVGAHLLVIALAAQALGVPGALGAAALALAHVALGISAAPGLLRGERSSVIAYRTRYRALSLGIGLIVLLVAWKRLGP